VIAVRVSIDDADNRLVADRLDLLEERRAPARVLGIDNGDAVGAMKTALLPPRPSSRKIVLELTSTTIAPLAALVGGQCHESRPALTIAPSTKSRLM
jgi:hypothetical protein